MTATRLVIVIILHAHHRDGELHSGEHDPIGNPEDQDSQPALVGMRDQMPEIADVEPKQHHNEDGRQGKANG